MPPPRILCEKNEIWRGATITVTGVYQNFNAFWLCSIRTIFSLKIWIFSISFFVGGFHTNVISSLSTIKFRFLVQKTSKTSRESILTNYISFRPLSATFHLTKITKNTDFSKFDQSAGIMIFVWNVFFEPRRTHLHRFSTLYLNL